MGNGHLTKWGLWTGENGFCVSGHPAPQDLCTGLGGEHPEEQSLAFLTVHSHGVWLGNERKVFKKTKHYLSLWTKNNLGTTLKSVRKVAGIEVCTEYVLSSLPPPSTPPQLRADPAD